MEAPLDQWAPTLGHQERPHPAPGQPLHSPICPLDQGGVQLLYADGKAYNERLIRGSASPGKEPRPYSSNQKRQSTSSPFPGHPLKAPS